MSKRQKRGCVLVLMGLVMVLIAMGMHLMQERQDQLAGENVRALLAQMELSRRSYTGNAQTENGKQSEQKTDETSAEAAKMPSQTYLGYSVIGIVRVPAVGIELPVLSDWSYDLLDIAPCRYSGSIETQDLILLGHNYKSHFTPLHQAAVGDTVELEDINGITYHYVIEEIEYLYKNEGERLPSSYALSIFTCTPGGQNRLVLRCSQCEN